MTARLPDLESTDERLREWGFFFRDHRLQNHCRSIEHRYRRSSEDADPDGWGDIEAAPKTQPAKSYRVLRAIETHEAIQELDVIYKWALTYAFAYPSLPRFVVLRCMKKWTGRRLNWRTYLEALDIARFRVHTAIGLTHENLYAISGSK